MLGVDSRRKMSSNTVRRGHSRKGTAGVRAHPLRLASFHESNPEGRVVGDTVDIDRVLFDFPAATIDAMREARASEGRSWQFRRQGFIDERIREENRRVKRLKQARRMMH